MSRHDLSFQITYVPTRHKFLFFPNYGYKNNFFLKKSRQIMYQFGLHILAQINPSLDVLNMRIKMN